MSQSHQLTETDYYLRVPTELVFVQDSLATPALPRHSTACNYSWRPVDGTVDFPQNPSSTPPSSATVGFSGCIFSAVCQ